MPLSPDDLASDAARTIALQMLQERGRGAVGLDRGGWDHHLCRVGRSVGQEPRGIQKGYLPDVNYVGGSRQLRRRVTPGPPPAMAGGGDSEK